MRFQLVRKMESKQEHIRERIVQIHKNNEDKGKKFTCVHFMTEGVAKRTGYLILSALRIERKAVSAGKPTIITSKVFR